MDHQRLLLYTIIFGLICLPVAVLAKKTGMQSMARGVEDAEGFSLQEEALTDSAPQPGTAPDNEQDARLPSQAILMDVKHEAESRKDDTIKSGDGESTAESPAEDIGTTEAAPAERWVSEEELNSFYKDAVFVGDSITDGFKLYCTWHMEDPFIPQFRFLARVSFGVHNALYELGHHTVNPIYEGEERYIWDSVQMMGAKQVYMMFGQNDLDMGNDSVEKYCEVINRIHAQSPDATFIILSMTYTLGGKGKGPINNENIRAFNAAMQQVAAQNGWGFIDMANPLADANGDLAAEYCSDHYVHMTTAAYHVWEDVLKQYAVDQLKYTPAPETMRADGTTDPANIADITETANP